MNVWAQTTVAQTELQFARTQLAITFARVTLDTKGTVSIVQVRLLCYLCNLH